MMEDVMPIPMKDYTATEEPETVKPEEYTNKEIFPFASNKDMNKEPIATEFKTPGYDDVTVASSDCSLDNITQGFNRLNKRKAIKKFQKNNDKIFMKEVKNTLKEVEKFGQTSDANLNIMEIWSQDCHDGVFPEEAASLRDEKPGLPFHEISAMNFIAGEDPEIFEALKEREKERQEYLQQQMRKEDSVPKEELKIKIPEKPNVSTEGAGERADRSEPITNPKIKMVLSIKEDLPKEATAPLKMEEKIPAEVTATLKEDHGLTELSKKFDEYLINNFEEVFYVQMVTSLALIMINGLEYRNLILYIVMYFLMIYQGSGLKDHLPVSQAARQCAHFYIAKMCVGIHNISYPTIMHFAERTKPVYLRKMQDYISEKSPELKGHFQQAEEIMEEVRKSGLDSPLEENDESLNEVQISSLENQPDIPDIEEISDSMLDLRESGLENISYPSIHNEDALWEKHRNKKLKNIRNNLLKVGNIRKMQVRKLDMQHVLAVANVEESHKPGCNNSFNIRCRTPIFGTRPYIKMEASGLPCKLLFDTGANCTAFTETFLKKVEKHLKKPLKRGEAVEIKGYSGKVDQDTAEIEITNRKIPGKTTVPAIISTDVEEEFDGIFGTNLMETFNLGLQFCPGSAEEVAITYRAPDGTSQSMDAVIHLEDDEDPLKIDDVHLKAPRTTRGYGKYTVVLDEQLNHIPGKAMVVGARVVNFSKEYNTAKRKGVPMVFIPDLGFEELLQEATYSTNDTFRAVVRSVGRLSNNDSKEEKLYTQGQPRYHKGIEEKLLPKLYEEGTIIGKAYPLSNAKAEYLRKQVGLDELDREGQILDRAETHDCVCEFFNDKADHTVILLGNRYGYNYQKYLQAVSPYEDFEKTKRHASFKQEGNVIAFKRDFQEDKYLINPAELVLRKDLVILTSYREDITPGQLKAIQELQNTREDGRTRLIRHQNKSCRECATLACQHADPKDNSQLLTCLTGTDLYYQITGSKYKNDELSVRTAEVKEHVYRIRGVANLQVYKMYGRLQIRIHLLETSDEGSLVKHMIYAQAYILNQFRILRLPHHLQIYGSWRVNENERTPLHRIVSCMRTLDSWEEHPDWYSGVQPIGYTRPLRTSLKTCQCSTCKNMRQFPDRIREHIWARLFKGTPTKIAEGTLVRLDLPAGFNSICNRSRREAEVYVNAVSIVTHRSLLIQCIRKKKNMESYKELCSEREFDKTSKGDQPIYPDNQVIRNRLKFLKKKKAIERKFLNNGGDIKRMTKYSECEKLMSQIMIKEMRQAQTGHYLAKSPRDSPTNNTKLPLPGQNHDTDIKEQIPPTPTLDPSLVNETEIEMNPPVRLKPPPEELMKKMEALEDDNGSTDTDQRIEEHIHKDVCTLEPTEIVGQRHREDEQWRDFWDEEKFPKDPKHKEEFSRILTTYNTTLSKRPHSWRLMSIPDVHIRFKENAEQVIHKYRQMNPVDDYVLTKKIEELISNDLLTVVSPDQNILRNITRLFLVKHNSAAGAKMIMDNIEKNDLENLDISLYRIVADFRGVNSLIYNAGYADYVMGTPQEIVSRMGGYTHFISVDLKSAYRSVPIDEETQKRLTVRADCSLYRNVLFEFKSLIDGISIAPQLFTQIILDALQPYLDRVVVWIDDITIMEKSAEKALALLEDVLKALEGIKALVALDKMQVNIDFNEQTGAGQDQLFGHMGFNIRLNVYFDKVKNLYVCEPMLCISVTKRQLFGSMEIPTKIKEIQMRLGCANFILDFLRNHTVNMSPFIEKLCKGIDMGGEPSEEMKDAWKNLLHAIQTAPDLAIINYMHTLYIEADSSLLGTGACMSQNTCRNGEKYKNILAYYSKRFKLEYGSHNKYTSVFRELLGLDYACEHWKKFIQACIRTCLTVDIASVVHMAGTRYISDDSHLSRIIGRILQLGTVFKLRHRPAKYSPIPDTLSRSHPPRTADAIQEASGQWVTATTGVPIRHLRLTADFMNTVPEHLPEDWLDEKTEVSMRELVNHLCEQIARNEKLSTKSVKNRYKSLLECMHDSLKPIVQEWDLRHGAANIDTPKVGTMVLMDGAGMPRRVAFVRNSEKVQKELDAHDAANKARGQLYRIRYEDYGVDSLLSMRGSDTAFLARMQDKNPEIRRIKYEIMTTPPADLDQRHAQFRLVNNQLLVTRKNKTQPFSGYNNLIYMAEKESLHLLFYIHQSLGHRGINGTYAFFRSYFDTGYIKDLCRIVSKSCGPCVMYNPIRARQAHPGRLPRKLHAGEQVYIDVAHFKLGFVKDLAPTDRRIQDQMKLVENLLVIQDSYSGRTAIAPMVGQTTEEVVDAIKMYQFMNIPIQEIHCDNAPSFYTKKFFQEVRPYGIDGITYSMPHSSTSNSRVERFIRSLREISFKIANFSRTSSLWNILYEANALLNQRPCEELRKFLPNYRSPPSRNDVYFGMKPRNLEINLEAALEQLPDTQARLKEREAIAKVVDEYNKEMDDILKKNNASKPINHEIQPGDMVLLKDSKKIHGTGRGHPTYTSMIYEVTKVKDHHCTLIPAFGKKTRTEQKITHLVKLAAPHCIEHLPKDIQASYGTPFSLADLKAMDSPPFQFVNYLKKPPGSKRETRTQKKKLVKRKRKIQPMQGNQVSDNFNLSESSESDTDSGMESGPDDFIPDDAAYKIDDWDMDWPECMEDQFSDPRRKIKDKTLGENLQAMEDYYTNSKYPDAAFQAYHEYQEHQQRGQKKQMAEGEKQKHQKEKLERPDMITENQISELQSDTRPVNAKSKLRFNQKVHKRTLEELSNGDENINDEVIHITDDEEAKEELKEILKKPPVAKKTKKKYTKDLNLNIHSRPERTIKRNIRLIEET